MSSDTVDAVSDIERAPRRKRGFLLLLRDIAVILVIAIVVSFVVKTFVVRSFYIPSGSMEKTLLINDRILVDELTPHFTGYQRGDVVVFRDPGGWLTDEQTAPTTTPSPLAQAGDWVLSLVGLSASDSNDHLIKRVIGIGGDHVVCCNALGQVTVNGTPIDETPYLNLAPGQSAPSTQTDPMPGTGERYDVTVPKGSLWVMGDNRDHSADSRFHQNLPSHGFVPLSDVVGRAFFITWPLDRFGTIDGHHDVFSGVPAKPKG